MNIKKIIKNILSPIMCTIHGIHYEGGVYIGRHVKLIRAKQMWAEEQSEFNPYSMVVCIGKQSRFEIGRKSRISMFSRIGVAGYVKIGKEVEMGPNIFIADYNHDYRDITQSVLVQGITYTNNGQIISKPSLEIGDGTWLGANVVVVGEIKIGKHCVIGANSVVVKDIPDYSVAVGAPAKVIKKYDFDKKMWVSVK